VIIKAMHQHLKIGDQESGVNMRDLLDSREFLARRHKETHPDRKTLAMERLNKCRSENPERILEELVQIAVDFCNADSAGISLEEVNAQNEPQFRWIAVAGSFDRYLNGTTPRFYSPCGTCIDRGVPQLYTVNHPYYNFLGVEAEPIRDGMLIPWRSLNQQGTLWLVSHSSEDAFDKSDFEFLHTIADLVSREIRDRQPQ
jgi:GAF domain